MDGITKDVVNKKIYNAEEVWKDILDIIKEKGSPLVYATWFKRTVLLKIKEGVVYIGVPNELVRSFIKDKYYEILLGILREKIEGVRSIKLTIYQEKSNRKKERRLEIKTSQTEMPFDQFMVNPKTHLNPRYTFDNLVIGPYIQLAYAAAQAIINNPGMSYNPFFVHGDTGVGKTHLLQAIGNKLQATRPDMQIYYMTSEVFAQDFLNSVGEPKKMEVFKQKYRRFDLLIVDDIQFFSGKDRSQEELFHLFNSLYNSNKQVLFSADSHPQNIVGIESRLKSRFTEGCTIEVPNPESESIGLILEKKLKEKGVVLDNDIINFIIGEIGNNGGIRDLLGIINNIELHMSVSNRGMEYSDIRNIVRKSTLPTRLNLSIGEVIKKVCDFYEIEEKYVVSASRRREVVVPRQMIMYITREFLFLPYATIGKHLGGRDHTTVIHSCEKLSSSLQENVAVQNNYKIIKKMLNII